MRILVTGAYGFIGAHIVAGLRAAGHDVIGCGRNVPLGRRLVPGIEWVPCDFNRDNDPAVWRPRLTGIDAVINCVGVLQGGRGADIEAVHRGTPIALFDACAAAGVRRVIQVSALGIEAGAGTEYADTKRAADDHLRGLDLEWLILRPSLVIGRGSYGGTSLFRGLAGFPFVTPVPGRGNQKFQPIDMDDLARTVRDLIARPEITRQVFTVAGPEVLTLREIIVGLRAWLGFSPAPVLSVPMGLIRFAGRIGDGLRWLGGGGPLTTTAIRQMTHGSVGDPAALVDALGTRPRRFQDALASTPAQVQDRWHARLYFLRPLLRVTLALFWIATGVVSIGWGLRGDIDGAPGGNIWFWAAALADLGLGFLLLIRWRVRLVGAVMVGLSLVYLAVITSHLTMLWADPLGPATKILPIIVATLVMMAIEDDR